MPSSRFELLSKSITELRRLLLPNVFDATGTYHDPQRVRARTLAFRILAHAELESYFEDRVIEIAKTSWSEWQKQRHVSRVVVSLLGFSGREMLLPAESLTPPKNKKQTDWIAVLELTERLKKCVEQFVFHVRSANHGIKEKDLLRMLLPIGFDYYDCDPLFLTTLNQFAELRGEAAHTSGASYVTHAVDPKDEHQRVAQIVSEVSKIDNKLDQLLTAARP